MAVWDTASPDDPLQLFSTDRAEGRSVLTRRQEEVAERLRDLPEVFAVLAAVRESPVHQKNVDGQDRRGCFSLRDGRQHEPGPRRPRHVGTDCGFARTSMCLPDPKSREHVLGRPLGSWPWVVFGTRRHHAGRLTDLFIISMTTGRCPSCAEDDASSNTSIG